MSVSSNYVPLWQSLHGMVCFSGHVVNILLNYRGPMLMIKLVARVARLSGREIPETYAMLRAHRKFVHDLLKDQNLSARIRKEYLALHNSQSLWCMEWEDHLEVSARKPYVSIMSFFRPKVTENPNGNNEDFKEIDILDDSSSLLSISEDESETYIESPAADDKIGNEVDKRLESSFLPCGLMNWKLPDVASDARTVFKCPFCNLQLSLAFNQFSAISTHFHAHLSDDASMTIQTQSAKRLEISSTFEARFQAFKNELSRLLEKKKFPFALESLSFESNRHLPAKSREISSASFLSVSPFSSKLLNPTYRSNIATRLHNPIKNVSSLSAKSTRVSKPRVSRPKSSKASKAAAPTSAAVTTTVAITESFPSHLRQSPPPVQSSEPPRSETSSPTIDFILVPDEAQPLAYHDASKTELGCRHYKVNCKFFAECCQKWFTCRFCHNEASDHEVSRPNTRYCLCMMCGLAQRAGQRCGRCESLLACYYCDKCKFWDNDLSKRIFHCDKCNTCRSGARQNFKHCDECDACFPLLHFVLHDGKPQNKIPEASAVNSQTRPPPRVTTVQPQLQLQQLQLVESAPVPPDVDTSDFPPVTISAANTKPLDILLLLQSTSTPNTATPATATTTTTATSTILTASSTVVASPQGQQKCWNCLITVPTSQDESGKFNSCPSCSAILFQLNSLIK